GSGAGAASPLGSGRSTSISSPAARRWARAVTGRPATRTAPPATSAAASARLTPATRATTRSSRWPSSARGTTSFTRSPVAAGGPARAGVAPLHDEQERGAGDDGGVGDVEDRPPLQVDEVDHAAAEEAVAGPDGAVDQVAEGAADHEPEGHRH